MDPQLADIIQAYTILILILLTLLLTLLGVWLGCLSRKLWVYLLACLPLVVWLIAPLLLQSVQPWAYDLRDYDLYETVSALQREFSTYFWVPFVLWFIVYVTYVWFGDNSYKHYKDIISPRKSLWIVSGMVVLGVALLLYSLFANPNFAREYTIPMSIVLTLLMAYVGYKSKKLWVYFLACLLPAVWLVASLLLQIVQPRDRTLYETVRVLQREFSTYFWVPFVLWFIVYVTYVWFGDDSYKHYKDIISPRKSVWTVFGMVVLGVALLLSGSFVNAEQQAYGRHAVTETLIDAIEETQGYTNALESAASSRATTTVVGIRTRHTPSDADWDGYFGEVKLAAEDLEDQTTIVISLTIAVSKTLATNVTPGTAAFTNTREALVQIETLSPMIISKIGEMQRYLEVTGTVAVSPTTEVSGTVGITPTTEVTSTVEVALTAEVAGTTVLALTKEERRARLVFLADEINDIAWDLRSTLSVLALDSSLPFLIITVLFAIFLLIPWLLYFTFIISKRSTLVRDTRNTLYDLGLLRHLLDASEALGDEEQRVARVVGTHLWEAVCWLDELVKNPTAIGAFEVAEQRIELANAQFKDPTPPDSKDKESSPDSKDKELSPALEELKKSVAKVQLENTPSGIQVALDLAKSARDEALVIVVKQRRFYSREYIIPLALLTLLTGVGWYYTFLPEALAGLVQLILNGAALAQLTTYLTKNFTPITMTFAGAWLFTTVMLMARWKQDDLYPRSFFYAAMRIVFAFLVGVLFAAWLGEAKFRVLVTDTDLDFYVFVLMVAFAVGAAPLEFIRAVLKRVGSAIADGAGKVWQSFQALFGKDFKSPDWGSKHPLTKLEDLTIWDDTRLDQEGIQNVHALATADLERLVMNTPFDAQQLIDWVDQALLSIHAKDLWRPGLSAICVRTATDLLDFCWSDNLKGVDVDKVDEVVKAFNHAQGASLGKDDPRVAAQDAGSALRTAADNLGEQAKTAKETAEKLDEGKPETLDNIKALQKQVEAVGEAIKKVTREAETDKKDVRVLAKEALDKVADGEALNDAKKAWQDDSALATKLDKAKKAVEPAKAATSEDKVTLEKLKDEATQEAAKEALGKATEEVAALRKAAAAVKAEAEAAKKKVTEVSASAKAMIAKQKADSLKTAVDALLAQAEEAKKSADGLQTNQDETLKAAKAAMEALQKAATAAKEAAEALVKAVADGGDPLKSAKSTAEAIRDKLKDGSDVQKKINTAKGKVEAATDAAKIQAAQGDVEKTLKAAKGLSDSSTSPASGTVDAAVKSVADTQAYKDWKDALDKAKDALAKVTELEKTATGANDIAAKLDKDKPATWDNVEGLKSMLGQEGLTGLLKAIETKRADALAKLEALREQETYAVAQARRTLEALAKNKDESAHKKATQEVEAAEKSLEPLSAKEPKGLAEAIGKVKSAVEKVEKLKSEAENAAEEAIQAALPLQLTEGILKIMLAAMERDPNIAHVRRFWNKRGKPERMYSQGGSKTQTDTGASTG